MVIGFFLGVEIPIKHSSFLMTLNLSLFVFFFFAEVEEVVSAIVYLLSDKASMINGTILPVDGGFLAR